MRDILICILTGTAIGVAMFTLAEMLVLRRRVDILTRLWDYQMCVISQKLKDMEKEK